MLTAFTFSIVSPAMERKTWNTIKKMRSWYSTCLISTQSRSLCIWYWALFVSWSIILIIGNIYFSKLITSCNLLSIQNLQGARSKKQDSACHITNLKKEHWHQSFPISFHIIPLLSLLYKSCNSFQGCTFIVFHNQFVRWSHFIAIVGWNHPVVSSTYWYQIYIYPYALEISSVFLMSKVLHSSLHQ